MEAIYDVICDQSDRAQWLQHRTQHLGASDLPAMLGVSRFSSRLGLYSEKLGLVEPEPESEYAYWGKILEPHVIQRYSHLSGRTVFPAGELLRSKQWPWLGCTLDAIEMDGEERGGCEIKVTKMYHNWRSGPPRDVYTQCQGQMAVTGFRWVTVVVLFQAVDFYWTTPPIERDEEFIAKLVGESHEFWRRIQDHDAPEATGSPHCTKALKKLFPDSDEGSVFLEDGDWLVLDEQREVLGEEIKRLELRKDELSNRLRQAIGNHDEGVLTSGVKYTHKKNRGGNRSLLRKESKEI